MTIKDLWNKLDVIAIVGFLIAIEQQITNGSMSFAHTLPDAWIPIVKEWAANLASIGGLTVGILRMSSNSSAQPSITPTIVKILIAAFVLSAFLFVDPVHAQAPRTRPAAANPIEQFNQKVKDDFAKQNAAAQAIVQGTSTDPEVSCDFHIFLGLTPKNLEAAIKKCISDANSTLVDDTQRALDSARAYTQTGATTPTPDNDAINCLTPGLAILKAGVIVPAIAAVPAVPATATTPEIPAVAAVPAKNPGLILLFQKYREFVLAGGLTSCKTWVDTAVNATATQAVNNVGSIAGAAAILAPIK